MRYTESAPPFSLAGVVQAVWVVEGEPGTDVRIVPDACVDLIALDDGIDSILINGPMPVAEVVTLRAPRTHGIRLVPGTLPLIGGITSLHELRGQERAVPGPSAQGEPALQLLAWARELLESGLLRRHDDVDAALASQAAGSRTTATRRVGPRQMQRLFATYVGLSPRETFGVVRQSLVARELRGSDTADLAMLAANHGYADQSHLTRVFSRLTGVPPGRYRREVAEDVFVQEARDGGVERSDS